MHFFILLVETLPDFIADDALIPMYRPQVRKLVRQGQHLGVPVGFSLQEGDGLLFSGLPGQCRRRGNRGGE